MNAIIQHVCQVHFIRAFMHDLHAFFVLIDVLCSLFLVFI